MAVLNLFEGWSKEKVKAFADSLDRSEAISKGVRSYWDNISSEEYERRCEINGERWTEEERQKASEKSKEQWADYSKEGRQEVLNKVFLNEEYRDSFRQMHANMSEEEKEEWIGRSFHSEEARRLALERMPEGIRKGWASLSPEEKDERILKSVSASAKANAVGPSGPELFLGFYLEKNFPGEWIYNGDGSQGVIIGGKIPDFVNVNGKKEVIEVFGTYWHSEDEVEEKKKHYKKFGFDCKVLWDYEFYFSKDIERVLGG